MDVLADGRDWEAHMSCPECGRLVYFYRSGLVDDGITVSAGVILEGMALHARQCEP